MNSLKSHISLILSLVSILITISVYIIFSQILTKYQKNIINKYSITIVSTKKITNLNIKDIQKIEPIDTSKYIKNLKNNFPDIDFNKINFPYFYSIKLKYLPSPSQLKEIKAQLLSTNYIKRVLTYSSNQTKIYNLLFLLKKTSQIFMIIVSILGFLLIIKQLEVWKFEHSERMYIMELFGAPFWFRGASLFKIAFIDSIISFIISVSLLLYFTNSAFFQEIFKEIPINYEINFGYIFLKLIFISLIISITSSIIVVIGRKK